MSAAKNAVLVVPDEEAVHVEISEYVAVVTLNRPTKLNALDPVSNLKLYDALQALVVDDNVRVIILTGTGERAFCVGGDLSHAVTDGPQQEPLERRRISFGGGLTGVGGRLVSVPKPMIAAVNGYAIGGGFELAMACDVIVASSHAQFGLPEARNGWISDSPAVHRAVRHLPYHVAMGMILTGRRMDAPTALRSGLLNEVVEEPAELLDAARAWAADILLSSPLALRAIKESATQGLETGLEGALGRRWETIEEFQFSADRAEGIAAFTQKRPPRWTAR